MKASTKVLPIASAITLLAGAIAAANAAPERAAANPLRVGLYPSTDGLVEVVLTNTSQKTARVPKWQLPKEVLDSNLFSIYRDGQKVAYEGPMIKRGVPKAQDFAILRPGQTLRTVVDLSASYDLARAGDYTITLNSALQFASLSGGQQLKTAQGLPMQLKSPTQRFWHNGGLAKPSAGKGKPTKGSLVDGVNYTGCSATQITQAGAAVTAARNYSQNARGYLASNTTGPRYTTWFGAYTASRYGTASQNFVNIDDAMDQNNGEITINCGCSMSAYAYVYPTRPYEIFVCRAFWNAPNTGTDSKAGTLIHEMSHFNVVAGTDDVVYGQSGARNLASTNPDGALNNADNHEYFAENTPAQN